MLNKSRVIAGRTVRRRCDFR